MREAITAYATKYALTKGILIIKAEVCSDISTDMISDVSKPMAYYHKGEWSRTLEEAQKVAEAMRVRKVDSLRKQLDAMLVKTIQVVDETQ